MSDASPGSDSSSQDSNAASVSVKPTLTNGVLFNIIVPLALLTLGAGFVIAIGKVQPKARPADDMTRAGRLRALPEVHVERLSSLDLAKKPLQLEVDGTVVPFREALVAAEVAGRIVEKSDKCEAGEFVSANDLLMVIDKIDYELEVQRLSRLREQEYQALLELDQEVVNLQRSVEVAEEDVKLQQAEVDRVSALPEGFASRGEVDQAKRLLLQAKQQLISYENQGDLLKKRRARLEATERLVATQLKAAEVNLKRCEIRAPIDGVIVMENVDLNSFVARGNTLVTIEDTSKVQVATNLRMDQLYWILDQADNSQQRQATAAGGYLLPETPAIIEYELNGRERAFYRWRGRLLGYDGIGLDPKSRTVPVRVVVDDPRRFSNEQSVNMIAKGPSALVRGMYVRVKLLIKPKTPLVVIPARALKPGNRVWQFIPDESVLESTGGTDSQQAAGDEALVDSDQQAFDPDAWTPGRVVVRKSIVPVDSLRPLGADLLEQSKSDPQDRMWVCEVLDQSLTGGSFLVTSPLASVDRGGMPARADASAINPPAAKTGNVAVSDAVLSDRIEDKR